MLHLTNYQNDKLGIGSALVCTIHCLITPIVLLTIQGAVWWHHLNYIFLLISSLAVFNAFKHIHITWIRNVLLSGIVLLGFGIFLAENIHWFHYVGYMGSCCLIFAHTANIYLHLKNKKNAL